MDKLIYPYIKLPIIYINLLYSKPTPPIKATSKIKSNSNDFIKSNLSYEDIIYEGRLVSYENQFEKFRKINQIAINKFYEHITAPSFGYQEQIRHNPLEKKFAKIIQQSFKTKAHLDAYLFDSGTHWYPDILLSLRNGNLVLDIEIDEPYAWQSKQPIHYDTSNDNLRDQILNDNGWTVIRFTEKQIKKQPIKCLELIAATIKNYFSFKTMPLGNDYEIIEETKWTYTQALFLAKNYSRMKY